MSTPSAQCDELRAMAESVGLEIPKVATLMMEAADAITELRGALQVASVDYRHLQDENAKLRERAVILRQGRWSDGPEDAELMEHAADAIEQLERKNDKLRELVRDMRTCIGHACLCDFCPLFVAEEDIEEARCIADMDSRMRELGVELRDA